MNPTTDDFKVHDFAPGPPSTFQGQPDRDSYLFPTHFGSNPPQGKATVLYTCQPNDPSMYTIDNATSLAYPTGRMVCRKTCNWMYPPNNTSYMNADHFGQYLWNRSMKQPSFVGPVGYDYQDTNSDGRKGWLTALDEMNDAAQREGPGMLDTAASDWAMSVTNGDEDAAKEILTTFDRSVADLQSFKHTWPPLDDSLELKSPEALELTRGLMLELDSSQRTVRDEEGADSPSRQTRGDETPSSKLRRWAKMFKRKKESAPGDNEMEGQASTTD
ncbi:hypothetical protein IAT38_006000 [Cryptococcus sp. DSM 104549]